MSRRRRLPAEPFQLEIQHLLPSGRGAAVHLEKALEVHDALAGETVMARYLFGRRFRGQATAVEVLDAAATRIEPRCPHFGTCSACVLQHMEVAAQLDFKQTILLRHLGEAGLEPGALMAPLSAGAWQYRRKARLSVRHVEKKGGVLLGFRERDGRFVTDMRECHVLAPVVAQHLDSLRTTLNALDGRAVIPQIEVSCGDASCALVIRHLEELAAPDLARLRQFARSTGLYILLQAKGPDTVVPLGPAEATLSYALPAFDLEFCFQPLDFIQVNGELNRLMVEQAIACLRPGPGESLLDLFCGLGNFTLPLARSAGRVVGVEGDAGLVARACANARANGIENTDFREADLYAGELDLSWTVGAFDKVLLDPPRSGAGPVLRAISDTGASRVVYVSCNPETLARDAATLVDKHGFRLAEAGVMDMFPQTTHIESMAVFEREAG